MKARCTISIPVCFLRRSQGRDTLVAQYPAPAAGGQIRGWGQYEDGELYSYAFFFHRGNIFFLIIWPPCPPRGKGMGGTFLCLLQRQLAPAMLMGEVEVPDGERHDELWLRRMHFYVRHGFVLEPVRSRVYGVTYRVISYAALPPMTADDVCAALRAIYEEAFWPAACACGCMCTSGSRSPEF